MSALNRKALQRQQTEKLRVMLGELLKSNSFYRAKLPKDAASKLNSLKALRDLPFTIKRELVEDQISHPPFGTNLTYPLERYIKIHQTSGTTGKPMYCLDTEESWQWWARCWKTIFEAAGVHAGDRIYFAFSFGPFIAIVDYGATVLISTPTYAVHLASEAKKAGIDLAKGSAVRITIHAGEPGASIPATKKLLEEAWGAKCYDHPGASEVGAYGFECEPQPGGVHINEEEFIAEVIHPESGDPVKEGEKGELVMTNLGRIGNPVIRYRTGDLVEPGYEPCKCGRSLMLLKGGVLGRIDDMIIIRGVNIFPSSIESIVREFADIEEFRVEVFRREALPELKLILEPRAGYASPEGLREKVTSRVRESIGIRPQVELAPPGALPRFELKAKRFFKL
ncbi:MAG: phenylacetate--CoA ligase family protein [Deltaproteobacteria bacterium]|nr:phenylacetate--CoA ligase family protein [Deltaproteobacteria bacterium]